MYIQQTQRHHLFILQASHTNDESLVFHRFLAFVSCYHMRFDVALRTSWRSMSLECSSALGEDHKTVHYVVDVSSVSYPMASYATRDLIASHRLSCRMTSWMTEPCVRGTEARSMLDKQANDILLL